MPSSRFPRAQHDVFISQQSETLHLFLEITKRSCNQQILEISDLKIIKILTNLLILMFFWSI